MSLAWARHVTHWLRPDGALKRRFPWRAIDSELTTIFFSRRRWGFESGAAWLCVWAAVCSDPSIARAQDGEGVVGEIRFEGTARTTDAYLLSIIRVRPGDALRRDELDADVVRLLRTGKFLTVRADRGDVDAEGRVAVTFRVVERPIVAEVRFEGNRAFTDKVLVEKVPLKPDDPFDAFALREGRDNILLAYHDKGYGYATVEVDEASARASGSVVYVIEEGPRVRVRAVLFEGNTAFEERVLRKKIRTKTALWVIRAGVFDPQTAEEDTAELQRFYREEGYLDARVSYRVDPGEQSGDLQVVFTIVEGQPYVIESVRIQGNTVFSDDEILGMIASQPMGIIKQGRFNSDITTLQTAYGERGYIGADVRGVRVFADTPGFVIVTFTIVEGEPVRVGRIVVRGNETTQDKVVRRALDLYPGDVFNLTLTRQAEKRLRATEIFDRVSLTPVGTEPGVRDILVNVRESEKRNDLVFGFGVTSNSGLVGSVLFDIRNFDIFDAPRSFSEFIRFRSFRGAGQRLRLELQPGTDLNRFRIDFTEPYLFDQPLRFDLSLSHFTRFREGFDEQRTGGSVSFGRRLVKGLGPRGWFTDWYGEVSFRMETVRIDDIDVFADKSVQDARGSHFLTSARGTLVRDRTDSRFLPTEGDRWSLSYEQFVGDFNFGKVRAGYARHFPLHTDARDRKSVLSVKLNAGLIVGDAPVFEKFYAGGLGSIRGFDFRGVGPHGGLNDDAIGGEFLAEILTEYSFPLAGEMLRGVVFFDQGTVEEEFELSTWRASVGVGLRLNIDFFGGPLPIEIDFAVPVLRDADDEEEVFSFFIGGSF